MTHLEFSIVVGDLLRAKFAGVSGLVDDVSVGEPRLEGRLVHLVLRLDVPPKLEGAMENA